MKWYNYTDGFLTGYWFCKLIWTLLYHQWEDAIVSGIFFIIFVAFSIWDAKRSDN